MRPRAAAVVVAALALASLALPAGEAQQAGIRPTLTIAVTDPGADLVPSRPTTLEVRVRYAYGPGAVSNEPVAVTVEIGEQPSWASGSVDTPVLYFTVNPGNEPENATRFATGGSSEQVTTVNLTIDPLAPAEKKEDFTVKATSTARGNLQAATAESPPIGLTVAFVGTLNVTGPASVVARGGVATGVPFVVKNLGNGDTKVNLAIRTTPENSLAEVVPAITLARGARQTVEVRLRTPWVAPERGFLELEAVSERAGEDAEASVASTEVVGRAVVPAAPLGPAFALAAAVALACARPSRR